MNIQITEHFYTNCKDEVKSRVLPNEDAPQYFSFQAETNDNNS